MDVFARCILCCGVFLLTSKALIATSSIEQGTCSMEDLSAKTILRCTDWENNLDTSTSDVESGTRCQIICPQRSKETEAECIYGYWINACTFQNDERELQKEKRELQRIHRVKRGWFRRIVRRVVRVVKCTFWRCRRRDNTPPVLHCPPTIHADADYLQVNTKVSWTEPIANDGRDGRITPTRHGKGPNKHFWGHTVISYHARDRSGNMAQCSFSIIVTVRQCPALNPVQDGYFICHPGSDYRYGSSCIFGCYNGHELEGSRRLECQKSQTWSASIPRCIKVTCDVLPPASPPSLMSCTDSNYYRSLCTYTCAQGYDIQPGMTRVIVCNAYGQWRGNIPICKDVDPPNIRSCNKIVYNFAQRNSSVAQLTWTEPTVEDNHDSSVNLVKVSSVNRGDELPAGSYDVRYTATDSAGNTATPCRMKVIVKVLSCPKIYATPFLTVSCPSGHRYGAHCDFQCDVGTALNGSIMAVCDKRPEDVYASWTYATQPFCEVIERCKTTPRVPRNGALACDNWLGGKFCQMLCKTGYDVQVGFANFEMMVCDNSGKWFPEKNFGDCGKARGASAADLRMSIHYYFSGDCNNLDVIEEIKVNFISALRLSNYQDACLTNADQCDVKNVQVHCGGMKRSVDMQIDFIISMQLGESSFQQRYSSARNNIGEILQHFSDDLSSGVLDLALSNNISVAALDISSGDLDIYCENNSIPSYSTLSCVLCGPGSYKSLNEAVCKPCPRGTYQSLEGQDECLPCPFGKTTENEGAIQSDDCTVGCDPGTFSANGLPPCSMCPVGYYSEVYGSTECISCSGSKSTEAERSSGQLMCKEFDVILSNDSSSITTTFINDVQQSAYFLSLWIQKESAVSAGLKIQVTVGSHHMTLEIHSDIYIGINGLSQKIQNYLSDERWHFLALSVNGSTIKFSVGEGSIETISSGETLILEKGSITFSIEGEGIVSQLNLWSPIHSFTEIQSKATKCFSTETGDIFSWKQMESGRGEDVFFQLPSECDDFNDCSPNPCQNGDCYEESSSYVCKCYYGFYGTDCEKNIDDCADHVCQNNATCLDGAANYSCLCPEQFTGEFCEIAMVDGLWSDWGEWSACSETCENGTKSRIRLCNNPSPDNGGHNCSGDAVDVVICQEMETCPVCGILLAPDNSTLDCQNLTDGTINCTLECNEGYDFDHTPKPYYTCGPDTFFLWDFQVDDNAFGRLPFCNEIARSTSLSASLEAKYQNLTCDSQTIKEESVQVIQAVVHQKIGNIGCVQTGLCTFTEPTVTNCNTRRKRSTVAANTGFKVLLTCNPKIHGTEACVTALTQAVEDFKNLASNSSLATTIQGTWYDVTLDESDLKGIVECPSGHIDINIYCVPCSLGRYYLNDDCVDCPYGTYQDLTGQTSCKSCPDGKTTAGTASVSLHECSVEVVIDTDTVTTKQKIAYGLTIGLSLAAFLVVVTCGIIISRRILIWKKRKVLPHNKLMSSQWDLSVFTMASPSSAPLGTSLSRFKVENLEKLSRDHVTNE